MTRAALLPSCLLGAAIGLVRPGAVRADDVDVATQRVEALAQRVQELDAGLHPPPPPSADEADRRLVDAQVQYGLHNYADASILLYDIVEKYPGSAAWPEALWYLADSLYQKGDLRSAHKYFDLLLEKLGPQSSHYQEALARILEISVKTQDAEAARDALARLASIPQAQLDPLVPYARGRFAFFENRFDDAIAAFQTIPAGSPYFFRGRYFLGASFVAAGKLPEAASAFTSLLTAQTGGPADEEIVDLAHLALGRVFYARGELDKAIEEYGNVSHRSKHFDDALYESAWVYVKSGEYPRAMRAIDLCLLADPNADTVAESKLLQGNLEIRLAKQAEATDMFQKVKDEYGPIQQQFDAALQKHDDPKAFFTRILSSSESAFDPTAPAVPPLALKWIKDAPGVKRMRRVADDESEIRQELADSEKILGRLAETVGSPERVNIFPDLARARGESSTISNQLTLYRDQLATQYHDLVQPVATPEEAGQLQRLEEQRQRMERDIASLPQSTDTLDTRIQKEKARYQDLEQEQAKVRTTIDGLQAELVALRKYYHDTQAQQHITADEFEVEISKVQALIDQLQEDYGTLQNAVATSKNSIGVMDEQGQAELQEKEQYRTLVAQETALAQGIEQRLSPADRALAQRINHALGRVAEVDAAVGALNAKIDRMVEAQLTGVKAEIADAKAKVASYQDELTSDEGETGDLGGAVLAQSSQAVAGRLYDIVVRADVGLVDVAWALKQAKVDAYKQVADEEARENTLLDEEYQDLVKDDADKGAAK